MEYINKPNYLLEAFAYFGRRASQKTWEDIEERIEKRNMLPDNIFLTVLSQLKEITNHLDQIVSIHSDELYELFANLEGPQTNTIGSSSRCFILYYPWIYHYNGDLSEINRQILSASPEEIAYGIASSLDLTDEYSQRGSMDYHTFVNLILSQSYPEHTKIVLLELSHSYKEVIAAATPYLEKVLGYLTKESELLHNTLIYFDEFIKEQGSEAAFKQISTLQPNNNTFCEIRPFILGMDTNITLERASGQICVCCGILRKNMIDMIQQFKSSTNDVFDAFKLLGDRTRFDILCFLKEKSAYGQELSSQFDLSRNTISHHMNKLITAGLVTCTMEGNRVYYSLNKGMLTGFIEKQQDLFL